MKTTLVILGAAVSTLSTVAQTLPFISTHPQSLVVAPGSNATFTVVSTNATAYQWRFNGVDIAWGTTAVLILTNAQPTNTGYYMTVVKNATGWTPSGLAYLSVVDSPGLVPFVTSGNTNARAAYQVNNCFPSPPPSPWIRSGTARLIAGPELDQMQIVGDPTSVISGYFTSSVVTLPSVAAGRTAYYRVEIAHTGPCAVGQFVQQSTTLKLTVGGGAFPVPPADDLRFPTYIEWPDPFIEDFNCSTGEVYPPTTNHVLARGEYLQIHLCPHAYHGVTTQWRKDGIPITGATNKSLLLSNFQTADVGVYDCQALLFARRRHSEQEVSLGDSYCRWRRSLSLSPPERDGFHL